MNSTWMRHAMGVAAMMTCAVITDPARAAGGGVQAVLDNIIAMLTGGIGKSIATLAVMSIGAAWM
jgi:type IV secretion system protein VirB2